MSATATTGRKLFQHSGTALLFRGALAIGFGLLVASLPVATVFALVYVFGIYAITDGLANVAHYFYDPARHSRWSMAGGITAAALGLLVGTWALILGISQVLLALDARETVRAWLVWLLTGFVTIAFVLFLIVNPGAGILSLAGLLAAFSVVLGLLLIASGIQLRRRATLS